MEKDVNKSKILAVDDEKINRMVLVEILDGPYELRCAENAKECFDILETWVPDIILMDVKMPGVGGLEACQYLRALPGIKEVSIIFVSALSMLEERLAGYDAGGDDYITKPFEEKELIKKIQLALTNQRMRGQLKE